MLNVLSLGVQTSAFATPGDLSPIFLIASFGITGEFQAAKNENFVAFVKAVPVSMLITGYF